jgi:hypothetical protein
MLALVTQRPLVTWRWMDGSEQTHALNRKKKAAGGRAVQRRGGQMRGLSVPQQCVWVTMSVDLNLGPASQV